MAATVAEYLVKSAKLKKGSAKFIDKLQIVGTQFATLEGLKKASLRSIYSRTTIDKQPLIRPFTPKEEALFKLIKKEIDTSISIEDNFIRLLTASYIRKQIDAVNSITISSFNTNPLLGAALKLDNPEELVRYCVYASASRSLVTSMGTMVEDLLLYSNVDVKDGADYQEGLSNKWDLVIERLDSVRTYIEVKSGPNDMDKTQIKSYSNEIKALEADGYKGFIGIGYGRKDMASVTTPMLRLYLDDWEEHTLIGTELWEYVSNHPGYHMKLMTVIKDTASVVLKKKSIIKLIEQRIKTLTAEFKETYSSIDDYYSQLW